MISTAVQRGGWVYVYDEKGSQIATIDAADGLQGYTSNSVSVKRGGWIYIYDERGSQINTISAS